MTALCKTVMPNVEVFNIVDESLLQVYSRRSVRANGAFSLFAHQLVVIYG